MLTLKYRMMRLSFAFILAFVGCFLTSSCKDYEKYINMAELEDLERLIAKAQLPKDSLTADRDSVLLEDKTDSLLVIEWKEEDMKHNQMMVVFRKVVLEGHDYWTAAGVGESRGGVGLTHSQSCKCWK